MAQRSGGKRKGTRRAARPPRRFRGDVLALAGGVTLAVVAWGYLVRAAIDFGANARDGEGSAWAFLALAAIGAAACLFVALLMGARTVRALGQAPVSPGSAGSDQPTGSRQRGR